MVVSSYEGMKILGVKPKSILIAVGTVIAVIALSALEVIGPIWLVEKMHHQEFVATVDSLDHCIADAPAFGAKDDEQKLYYCLGVIGTFSSRNADDTSKLDLEPVSINCPEARRACLIRLRVKNRTTDAYIFSARVMAEVPVDPHAEQPIMQISENRVINLRPGNNTELSLIIPYGLASTGMDLDWRVSEVKLLGQVQILNDHKHR